ncbi:MAG: FumA C-terminus/TtdB family hydratase beta subunit [Clostridia bacterium]|nr:FumA C-terminus/TtdB family hydratase beta subunit [Clostridia bacterium]
MSTYNINLAEIRDEIPKLKAGDRVLLNGTVYTSRDAAHKRIFSLMDENRELPFELKDACIYFAGPTPTPENMAVGSCGPTTAGRMDKYSPRLLDAGLAAMIGKGLRNDEVKDAIIRNKAVYFCAIGGAGALYSGCITSCEEIAFKDLGCESVKRMTVKNFPVYVGIDSSGNDIYTGRG